MKRTVPEGAVARIVGVVVHAVAVVGGDLIGNEIEARQESALEVRVVQQHAGVHQCENDALIAHRDVPSLGQVDGLIVPLLIAFVERIVWNPRGIAPAIDFGETDTGQLTQRLGLVQQRKVLLLFGRGAGPASTLITMNAGRRGGDQLHVLRGFDLAASVIGIILVDDQQFVRSMGHTSAGKRRDAPAIAHHGKRDAVFDRYDPPRNRTGTARALASVTHAVAVAIRLIRVGGIRAIVDADTIRGIDGRTRIADAVAVAVSQNRIAVVVLIIRVLRLATGRQQIGCEHQGHKVPVAYQVSQYQHQHTRFPIMWVVLGSCLPWVSSLGLALTYYTALCIDQKRA